MKERHQARSMKTWKCVVVKGIFLAITKQNCSFFLLNPNSILKSFGNYLFMNQEFHIQEDIAPPLFCFEQFSQRTSLKLEHRERELEGLWFKKQPSTKSVSPSLPHAGTEYSILSSGHSCGWASTFSWVHSKDGLPWRITHNTFKPSTVLLVVLAQYQPRWIVPSR